MTTAELLLLFRRDQARRGLARRTIHTREGITLRFARWLERPLCEATPEDVELWLDSRPIGTRSRYCYLSNLAAFYRWAVDKGACEVDPTLKIERPKMHRTLPRPALSSDLLVALARADSKRQCWVLLAALAGLRCVEIAGLRREDIDEYGGVIRVVRSKGAHERVVPLHPQLLQSLRTFPMPRTGWLFTRPRGGPYTPAALSSEFNAFLHDAGLSCTAHQLRHWFGTHLYGLTKDLRMVQEAMGHASPTTTAGYVRLDMQAAAVSVAGLTFEGAA